MPIQSIPFNTTILETYLQAKRKSNTPELKAMAIHGDNLRDENKKLDSRLDKKRNEAVVLETAIMRNNLLNSITFLNPADKDTFQQKEISL